jgi:hypothetical protein
MVNTRMMAIYQTLNMKTQNYKNIVHTNLLINKMQINGPQPQASVDIRMVGDNEKVA